jgi:hypothetical protein
LVIAMSPWLQWLWRHPSFEVEARLAIADERLKSFVAMAVIVKNDCVISSDYDCRLTEPR